MNGEEQTAGAAVAEGDRRVESGVGGVHAVAEPITATTRVVPLIEAVELNPRANRAVLSDDLVVSFVPMAAVEAGSGRMDANAVRRFGDVKKGYTTFGEGDVLFAKITPCMENGKMAVARGLRNSVGCGSTEFHVLRPRRGVDAHYIYHFVSRARFRAEAAHHMTGAVGQKRVPAAFLEQCEIPLPDLDEQRRIVAEIEMQFSRLDEAVANLKRVVTRLSGYRQRTLDDAFASDPNAALGQLIADGPQNGLYLPKDAYGSGTPILRIDDYQTDWIRPVGELRRVRAAESQVSTWALLSRDLLVNRVNSLSHLGKCVVVPDALAGALFESNMMRFRLVPGVLPRYVELYLGSRTGKRRLTANAKWAVNQASINQKDVQATMIPLPSPERQAQIVAEVDRRLSIVREVEAEVDANLKRAQALRQSVLRGAFTGK